MLVETLKKQHVGNFAMQQQLMSAIAQKTAIENWKRTLVDQVRRSEESLVEQNMSVIQEMKQVQRQFTELAQSIGGKQMKGTQKESASAGNKNEGRQTILDMQKLIEGTWIKMERINTEMIRTFSQLLGK